MKYVYIDFLYRILIAAECRSIVHTKDGSKTKSNYLYIFIIVQYARDCVINM
jgi:hypothetical protein